MIWWVRGMRGFGILFYSIFDIVKNLAERRGEGILIQRFVI
jgi:hypothetical protein